MQNLINIKIAFLLIILPNFAFAYVGPGMGGGLIVAVLGIFVAIFLKFNNSRVYGYISTRVCVCVCKCVKILILTNDERTKNTKYI